MKRFLTFLVPLLIIAVALLACGESTTANNTGTTGNTPTANTPAAAPKHFKVGDTVTVGSTWKVVVNSIATNPGDQFNTPTKGQYVVVDISLTNISSQEQNVSSLLNFKFKGSDGTGYDEAIVGNLANVNPPPDGKVEAGGITKGDFVYDVPTTAKTFTLSFEPDITSSGETIWDLSV